MEQLTGSEIGRLFNGLIQFYATGEEPELKGNERFVYPTAKKMVERVVENGSKI